MTTSDALYQSLVDAFNMMEERGEKTVDLVARAAAVVLTAFADEIARSIQHSQDQRARLDADAAKVGPAASVKDGHLSVCAVKRAAEGVLLPSAELNHPATDDFYASDDYPADGCLIVATVKGCVGSVEIYRPGTEIPTDRLIYRESNCDATHIGGRIHRLIHSSSRAG